MRRWRVLDGGVRRRVLRPAVPVYVVDMFAGFDVKARRIRHGWRGRRQFKHRQLEVVLTYAPRTRQPDRLKVELWLSVDCAFVIKSLQLAATDHLCFQLSTGDERFDSRYAICEHAHGGIREREFVELWLALSRVRAHIQELVPHSSKAELLAGFHTLTLSLDARDAERHQLDAIAGKLLELAATLQLYCAPSL